MLNPICFPPSSLVDLYIPKISISRVYDLGDILEDMGTVDLHSNQADFSGIAQEAQLKVSKVSLSRAYLFVPKIHNINNKKQHGAHS